MTVKTILYGFKVTGIHPLDRNAIKLPEAKESLAKKSELAFIPLYTPSKRKYPSLASSVCFSNEEFERCEESSLSQNESRCRHWLLPEASSSFLTLPSLTPLPSPVNHSCHVLPRQPALKRVVSLLSLTDKTNHQRCGGSRVLTSAECLKEIEEKERAKKEKIQKKEENRKKREEARKKKEEKSQKRSGQPRTQSCH